MLFKKKSVERAARPQFMQVNLVDVVKQASMQMKYEEIYCWLVTHKTPLVWCHDKGFSIVDNRFIEERAWLKRALSRMVKEIEEQKLQKQQQVQQQMQKLVNDMKEDKPTNTGYIG
ncbi:MAG: hypothetical protein QW063_00865 [Candidatus Nanoarchaeia archaeon]